MRLATTKDIEYLMKFIEEYDPDVLIVEGHDGGGKGRVIKEMVRRTGIKVYRPDYSGFWNNHIQTKKRWAISAPFFELIALTGIKDKLMIDRCMLSGAVYEQDISIAQRMADFTKNVKILHVLVNPDRDSYYKMQGVRLGEQIPKKPYGMFRNYMERFLRYADQTGIPYVEFQNEFSVKVGNKSMGACGGCDNWSTLRQDYDSEKLVGHCAHWKKEVFEDGERCPFYEEESDLNE